MTPDAQVILAELHRETGYAKPDLQTCEALARAFLELRAVQRAPTCDSLIPVTVDLSELDESCGPSGVDANGSNGEAL